MAWAVTVIAERMANGANIMDDNATATAMVKVAGIASAELDKHVLGADQLIAGAMERIKNYVAGNHNVGALLAPLSLVAEPLPATTTTETTMLIDSLLVAGVEAVDPLAVTGMRGEELDEAIGVAVARWPGVIESWSEEERGAAKAWVDAVLSSGGSQEIISAAPKHLLALPVGENPAPAIGATVRRNFGETSVDGRVIDIPAPCRVLVEVTAIDETKRELLDQHASQWRVVYST
jgi:hypothetical protein